VPQTAKFIRAWRQPALAVALLAVSWLPLAGPGQARGRAAGAVTLLEPGLAGERAETFVGAGDIADCETAWDESTANLVEHIPGTVFTLGDNAYDNGSDGDFQYCYNPSWGRFKDRTRPAPGNHDYNTPGAAGYFNYFGAAGHPLSAYYSYDLGGWHIIALNGECGQIGGCQEGSPQVLWLRADLAAHPAECTLAYWHEPRFSSGPHGSDSAYQPFWQALYDYHADVVLGGHDHDYERFAPQTPAGQLDWAHGLRQFVVGTGGRHFAALGPSRRPNSEVSRDVVFGVLKLSLYPSRYVWQYLPIPGIDFRDAGGFGCH
jgi:acid phosphatase type 7